jgi:REP element-mobilizing transposase RayT
MPRRNRVQTADGLYHSGTRGIRGLPVFVDDADRILFLAILADVVKRFDWECRAYCLMTNHYHLALRTPEANIGAGMHRLNGLYAQAFNRRHRFKGHLFEERYWSGLIDTEQHAFSLMRYVVLNPVRAGMCALPHQWPWSSYRATAGIETVPSFLDLRWLTAHGQNAYRSYVLEGLERPVTPPPQTRTNP